MVPRTNPDIEQQLAEFAPSQSPQEPTLDSVATAVAGTGNVPVVPQPFVGMPAVDDSDDANDNAARKVANQQRESVTASLATASRVDPNLAAEADKLGKRFGVGQDIALRNMNELRNRARLEDANVADLVKTDPVLAQMLADPAFASQASDDIGVLRILNGIKNEFERLRPPLPSTSGIGLAVAGGPIGILPALNLYAAEAVKHTATTAWDIVGLGFERGRAVAERGDIGAMEMAGLGSPAALDKAEYLQKRMQEIGQLGLVGSAAEMFGQNVANAKIIGTSAVVGALIGLPAGVPGIIAGGSYGTGAGIVISTAKMESGNLYLDLRAEGVPDSTAIPAAIIGGTINGFIELIGFKIAAAPFKKLLSEAIKKELIKQLKTATGRAAIKTAGKAYGVQVLSQGLEEGIQETVIITAEEVSKRISGIHSDTTLWQAAERIVESFLYGTMASALLGGIGPGANLIVDLNRAKVTSREQVALTALENNKAESKLADRNLPLYLQLLEAQLNGTPLETIYIEAKVLREVLEKNEVTLAQLEELFPGIGKQFKNAVDTSGDLTIPTAEYVAKLSGTPLGNALRPHIRGSAKSMSATEAIKFEAKREATLAQAKQLLAEQQAINENFEMGALQVEQQAFEQVMATGQYSEQEARAIAQLRAASVVVDAVAQGMTPMEWQMKYGKPLSVRGEGIQAPTAPMEQPDQFDQAGQRKTDTPEFREWNERPTEQGGTNKLVDEQGQPLRFYHGTSRGGFTQFDSAFLGTGAGYSRGGFSFVTSREQAEAYAERASEDTRIVESMLAELNPLFREQGMYERFAAAGIEAGVFDEESKEPAYWDSANVDEGSEQLYDQLDDWLVELRKVGDRDLVLRLGAIRDIGRPTAEPQVYEVYLYAGQQVREFNATPETIGDVLAGIDVRSQPGGAVIVNMSNGDKVVIVSDLTNIKSTDNRGTWSRATPNIFEQATRLPRVDGVALRRAMNQYIRNEIYARELIEEVNLFGLVTEEEVDDLLDQDAKDRVAGVSSRGGGATSIPGEMGRRGQHPLLALVRQREKERPTDIERRNALYLDAVQRGDMETAQRMVDEAARAAGYDRRGYHGLASGQLRGGEFDVGKLGSNTNAPSAKLGFFFSTRRQARTAEAYAYDIDADKAREYATMFQDLANELKARVPKKYHKELVSSLQGELERGKDAFFPITDVDEVTGEPIARSAAEYYGILSDAGLFALEDVLRIVDMMGYAGGVVKSERGSELETWAEKTWLKEWQKLAARASKQAKGTKSSIFTAALRAVNPLVHDYKGKSYREESYASVIARAKQLGHDSVILRNTYDGGGLDDIVVVFDPSQIKSADPVTYDEAGNIVPLSRRFDITSPKVFEQAGKPAPDVGIFDVNNPPAPTSARQDIKYGGPVVAVMDYDGKVYYDRNAEMHGDLLDTFPDLDPAMIIDGGFIIDGKYMPAMSDSGMSVNESDDDELIQRVRDLTERVNTPKPIVFEQAARPTRELGPIEAAKRLVQENGREAFTDADEFFKKRWNELLQTTKRQVKPNARNFREAAKRAVADILDFVKNNPKFADYYANDWKVTRSILDDYIGRAITDDEFAMFRTIAGLTSPNTMLPANISDTVGLWDHWMREGNFDAFTLGPKPGTGALVVFEAAEPISGTTANVKVRTIRIIERLIKERGGVTQALEYLQEGVPVKELHKFNRKMGYSGAVGDIGNITDLVQQATGQSKLIPRMFIFGQKVGAYTLNAIGDERYTTVDIWESRYIRSHFTGMFDINIGLPESTDEHQIFTRFGDLFKEEMEAVTGRKWAPSALQALRWFYIIGSAREAGYSKASTNETISFYTERRLVQAFGYPGRAATSGGPSVGTAAIGGAAGQVRAARIPPKRFERNLETDVAKLDNPDQRRRAIAAGYVRYARYNSELGQRGFSFDERRGGPARQHGILNATIAADFVPGERLQSAFGKANLPIQTMQELVADADGAQAFRSLVAATNALNPYGAAVAVYTAEEYQGKRLFVTEDATAGFALSADGDIVSVFSAPKSGNGRAVMALSVQVGGRRLDCFDTALPGYYAAHGFRAVARLAWNDEYAPTGWNKDTFKDFNDGRPDVVFMVYERGYNGEYKAGDGANVVDYDAGLQAQARALQSIAKSQEFQQAARGPARGGIDPRTLDIIVRKGADVSTLVHELLHLRIGEYLRMAGSGMATAQVLADLDILFNFMGVDGATAQERLDNYLTMPLEQRKPLEEKATYNFELYVYEGKSPSVELRGVFARLSMWLRRAYKSIRDDLNAIYRREFGTDLPILTPEVRGVFDRMFASEEQIRRQEAVNGMKGLFQSKDEAIAAGMSEAEWAAYQDMQQEATNDAVAQLGAATIRQMQWMSNARARILRDLQRQHAAKRKEVAAEVSAAIKVTPVYRAMTYLRLGRFVDTDGQEADMGKPHRLDIDQVNAMYAGMPEDARPDIKALGTGKNGMLEKGGLSPDMVAELFGYSSGDEMIRAMLAAKPMKDAVAERTDEVMVQRYSDMNSPAAVEAEVQKALHNEARARLVAVELRFLAKATQPVRLILEAARQVAADIIDGTVIREVRPNQYMAAEARAARDADRIQRTYDITEPAEELVQRYGRERALALVRAKQAQLYQNQLAAEALRVKDYVDKQVKYLRRVLRDENVKRMGAAAADQIAGLLERFEVVSVSLKRLDERRTMAKYLADLEAAGMVPDIAENIADEARRVNYRQMKVSEFRDLVDAVRQIEHVGKNEQKMRLAEERAAFAEKRDEIVTRIREVGKERELQIDPRTPLTGIGRTAAFLRGFAAQHLKAASIARILDGGKEDGPLWNAIIRTANDASDMETRMRAEASLKLSEILKPVFALGGMGGKGMFFPSINRSLNREARIAIALNLGNDGNRQRLLDGEGWTIEQLQPVLESLTEAEWLAVQQVWDFIDGYRPEIAAKERRLYGKEPEWVKPVPFTVRTLDGKEVALQGGYYPVKYDPVASDRVATVDAAEEAKRDLQGAYTAATTRRSFVKARAKEVVDRPLLYTLDAAFSGVNDVIHDLAWHEWLIGTNRLLRDTEFANAVRETRGPEFLKQLRDWAKDNATGARGQQAAGESVLSWLRQGISASGLGFNVVSAAMQVTGFNQSIVRVGAKYIGQGIVQFSTSPFESAKTVAEKCSFMAERGRTQFRELNEIMNRVRGQTEVARRVTAGTYFLMMIMQRSVDIPTWLGAYQKALDAGKDDAKAVALAAQAVRDSQGSGLVSDLSAIERGGPLMKLFTVFYSYMNTVYNMTAVQTMTARSRGKLAADYAMLLVVPVVLGYAIKSAIQPDADDDELDPEALARKLAAEELSYLMGTMVIVREFGGAAQLLTGAEGVRMGYGGPAGLRAVGEVYGLATQAGQLEFDRAFRRAAINTLGAFTGLPSAQINRTIDGIEALIEGEVEGPTAILAPLTGVQR